jgi:hypothetical protein
VKSTFLSIAAGAGHLELVDAACREKLRKLSKEGGIAESWKTAGILFLGAVITAAICLFFRSQYNATDISTSMRGGVRLGYWATLEMAPMAALGGLWFVVRAFRMRVAATFRVECPECSASQELSAVYRKRFALTCPACYAVVRGCAASYATRLRCDYCELEYFGAADADGPCPSCRRRGPGLRAKCPQCKQALPRGALCCVRCNKWLGQEESGSDSGTAAYDVTGFSSTVARTYVVELARRVLNFVEGGERIIGTGTDAPHLDPSTAGRFGGSLAEHERILPKLALGAQWLARPRAPATPLPAAVADTLARMEALLERLEKANLKPATEVLAPLRAARRSVAALGREATA